MQPTGLIDITAGQLTQRHHPQSAFVADQQDAPRQLSNAGQQRLALGRQPLRILEQQQVVVLSAVTLDRELDNVRRSEDGRRWRRFVGGRSSVFTDRVAWALALSSLANLILIHVGGAVYG